jgi:SAM-dependent methyltransferase
MRDLERPERRGRETAVEADKWSGSRHVVQVRPHVWGWLSQRVGAGPVLEIGPGLRPTAPVATSTFVDASLHALRRLEARGARTAEAGSRLPFEDGSFGAALAFEVLEHVEDDVTLLDEMARVVRPGGLLVLSTPVHASKWSPLDDACGHVRRDEPEVLFDKVRAAGFDVGGYAWTPPALAALTSLRVRALRSNRRLSTAFVQRCIFPFHAAYQRWFQRARWTAPDRPVPSSADDLMLWARRVDPERPRTDRKT